MCQSVLPAADADIIALANPLPYFTPDFEVQGLSDWGGPELPRVGDTLLHTCELYHQVPDDRAPTGAQSRLGGCWSRSNRMHA